MKTLSYEQWVYIYKPVKNHIDDLAGCDGYLFETFGDELEYAKNQPLDHIWTYVETDGNMYIVPGRQFVNRIGYLITQENWLDEDVEIKL